MAIDWHVIATIVLSLISLIVGYIVRHYGPNAPVVVVPSDNPVNHPLMKAVLVKLLPILQAEEQKFLDNVLKGLYDGSGTTPLSSAK